jgi:protein-disulfide isomerase-like protein with CxxC motif
MIDRMDPYPRPRPRPHSPGFRPTNSNITAEQRTGKTAGQRYSENIIAAKKAVADAKEAKRVATLAAWKAEEDAAIKRSAEREAERRRIEAARKAALEAKIAGTTGTSTTGTSKYRTQLTNANLGKKPQESLINRFYTLLKNTSEKTAKRPRGGRSTKRNRTSRNRTRGKR